MIDENELLERTVLEDLHLPASGIVINRAIGLGVGAPATEDGVREIIAAYRDAGGQAALPARRIGHAMALGCHRLLTCTGKAVPGRPTALLPQSAESRLS